MRAELAASLCAPEDRPVAVKVDPVKVDARLSGKPEVGVGPVEIELPEIEVTLPGLTLSLPDPTLKIEVGLGLDNAVEYLESMRSFMQGLQLGSVVPPVAPDPIDVVIMAAATAALGPGLVRALALPSIEVEAELQLGDIALKPDKALEVDLGEVRLHGTPVTDDDQPVTVSADLGETGVAAVLDGLRAALSGCLVLNGGDPPPAPPPSVIGVETKVDDQKNILEATIRGTGFGAVQGSGTAVLTQIGLSLSPDHYEEWTDSQIVAVYRPIPAQGAYSVVVTNASGVSIQSPPLLLP